MDGILNLYIKHFGKEPDKIEEIHSAVSTRRYFRLFGEEETVIGTFSPDILETRAFITFAKHFYEKGIHVPRIIAQSNDQNFYLQTDLGDQRLHEIIIARPSSKLNAKYKQYYKSAIDELVKLQIKGDQGLDYSISVPGPSFDRQAILWDLNHFKYYFLKPLGIPFDENRLEDSFIKISEHISNLSIQAYMFRDFQTRNIMMIDEYPFFIDFQGGRKGPIHYDLASLLFESKTGLTENDKSELLDYYIDILSEYKKINRSIFIKEYYQVALIRILQVLGTYGLRGNIEKKAVFIQSIPGGLKNLDYIINMIDLSIMDDYFLSLMKLVTDKKDSFRTLPDPFDGLTLTISSFSYRKPLPDDISGNGGGFVYDCRFLNNPGRFEEFKDLTGLDNDVIQFLKDRSEANEFVSSIKDQLHSVIIAYKRRNFTNLMVSFGCTGGRHRSVYVAKEIADWCRQFRDIRVLEFHSELDIQF